MTRNPFRRPLIGVIVLAGVLMSFIGVAPAALYSLGSAHASRAASIDLPNERFDLV